MTDGTKPTSHPKRIKKLHRNIANSSRQSRLLIFVVTFGLVGAAAIIISKAATPTAHYETEQASLTCASIISDTNASSGQAISLGCSSTLSTTGAKLPISYELSTLPTASTKYVATNGSDTTGTGTVAAPYATLSKAISSAPAGGNVVVRGGIYRNQGKLNSDNSGRIDVNKSLKMLAYPGEIPVFNGAKTVAGGWTTEGTTKYISYTPIPVTSGGMSLSTNQGLTGDFAGKYSDQAWIGNTQLDQVSDKTALGAGKFWVDQTNGRLYMVTTDADKTGIEVSHRNMFMTINAPNVTIEGLRITRYSNTGNNFGVILLPEGADNSLIRNVEIFDSALETVLYAGNTSNSGNLHLNSKMQNVTIENSNWMGVRATYTDNFTTDSVKIRNMNQFSEFNNSPMSGAIKTSRTWYTKVSNSEFSNNKSHALWFDQSNYKVEVAGNQIVDNSGSGVFFEISDNLLLINNYVRSSGSGQPLKLAGSSGLRLVNNTIVGGRESIGVYTDSRSRPGCPIVGQPECSEFAGSDRDSVRTIPPTMDWMPRIDLMLNNIVAYPTALQYCGGISPLCITLQNSSATTTIDAVIHKADVTRGIPQTLMNGNIYVNGSGRLIMVNNLGYSTPSAFSAAMSASPVSIPGLEANSLYGNSWVSTDGTPTSTLSAIHNQAIATPTDTSINQYIPAGTRHYGVTYR